MSEKKNIVIKVKYPSAGSSSANPVSTPNTVTQWNYKRIGLVLGPILLVIFSLLYFSGSDDSKELSDTPLVLPQQPVETKAPPLANNPPTQPKLDLSKAVVRAQLTKNIEKNEPVDKLKSPLKIGKKETIWIYYFAELKGMKGKAIYHEWLLNGELVSKKKVNISSDPWRTASKQVITYTTNNDWVVRLVDESGNKLAERTFNLELN